MSTTDTHTPPAPGSAEWSRLVTASKVAAILGVSPWESPRSLWHKMRGDIIGQRDTAALRRGNYLEAGVLAWWADQHDEYYDIRPQYYAVRDDLPWAAATLDGLALTPDGTPAVVEVKTAARADEWGTPGTDGIPTHYLAQVQWQLAMVPDAHRAYVAVLFGPGLEFAEYVVKRDAATAEALIRICRTFYESLTDETCPPHLDDTVATFEALRRLHPDINPDGTTDLPEDVAREYVDALAAEKAAVARARLAKSTVLDAMGTDRLAAHDGHTIARRQNGRGDIVQLRQVTTTWPTETETQA